MWLRDLYPVVIKTPKAHAGLLPGEFHADAAIIHCYGPDGMLCGHIEGVEANLRKPLVSISRARQGIFLFG